MIAIVFPLEFRKEGDAITLFFHTLLADFHYFSYSGKGKGSCVLLTSILILIQVDLEGLIMARQSSILIIGQDVLKTNGEVLL